MSEAAHNRRWGYGAHLLAMIEQTRRALQVQNERQKRSKAGGKDQNLTEMVWIYSFIVPI